LGHDLSHLRIPSGLSVPPPRPARTDSRVIDESSAVSVPCVRLARLARGASAAREPGRPGRRPARRTSLESADGTRSGRARYDIDSLTSKTRSASEFLFQQRPPVGIELGPKHELQHRFVAPDPFRDAIRLQIPIIEIARGGPD